MHIVKESEIVREEYIYSNN